MRHLGLLAQTLTARWRGHDSMTPAALQRRIERMFQYRGRSTLELRPPVLAAEIAQIQFYARPIVPGRRRQKSTPEAAFAEQLLQDIVTILDTVWQSRNDINTIKLVVWRKPEDAADRERAILVTEANRNPAAPRSQRVRHLPVNAADVLRLLGSHVRIDQHGNLHEEQTI